MKAISLWQPWASAIALGIKSIETRGWSTTYRGPLLIHAAQKWGPDQREFAHKMFEAGVLPSFDPIPPLGKLLCRMNLHKITRTELLQNIVDEEEAALGDYRDGRFGWMLFDRFVFVEPVQYRGAQGLFDVPDSVVAKAMEAVA